MSAADDTTRTVSAPPRLPVVWIQLHFGREIDGQATKIRCKPDLKIARLLDLVEAIYKNDLKAGGVGNLYACPPGTPLEDLNANDRLDPGNSVPGGTTMERPLMVMAPPRIFTLRW